MSSQLYQPSEHVLWRSRPQGQVGYVIPCTVVVDTPQVTVLFQATGSVCKRRVGQRGGPRGRSLLVDNGPASHEDVVWSGPPTLRLHPWGSAYSIIRSWNSAHACAEGWYVNLEAAWRRTRLGFDSQDLTLDITVEADLSSWAWKDEDELEWSVETGKYSAKDAALIREEGFRVIRTLEKRMWPFNADWSQWHPHPGWTIPTVPTDWADSSA
ncbi:MAG: DUF402 domain-containing protein [Caldilineaceae bacterium]|nr:DUF402 domain-containing protein [Caldilineaceae bacterium]